MGFTAATFGVLISKHDAAYHIMLRLIAQSVQIISSNGSATQPAWPYTDEINKLLGDDHLGHQLRIKLFDDVTLRDTNTFESVDGWYSLDIGTDDMYEFFRMDIQFVENSTIKIGYWPGGCGTIIGFGEVGYCEKLKISPADLVGLEAIRTRLINEKRLNTQTDYVLITNCC